MRRHSPISCCMIYKSKKTKKKDLNDTAIFVLCYNCEIVYNHETYLLLHLLPVQHLTVLISQLKKKQPSKHQNLFDRICRSAIRI